MRNTFSAGWIANIVAYLGLLALYTGVSDYVNKQPPPGTSRLDMLVQWGIAPALLLCSLAFVLKMIARSAGEQARTAAAAGILDDALDRIIDDQPVALTLYLRPFALTDKIRFQNPQAPLTFGNLLGDGSNDIERMLAEAVERDAMLIGLGRPGEHEGAGRLSVEDEQWQDAVKVLAAKARRIVLMPYPAEGTLWEVDHVFRSGLLDKTVFLMPPAPFYSEVDIPAFWQQCQAIALERLGARLPDYRSEGAFFTMRPDGEPAALSDVPLWEPRRMSQALARVMPLAPQVATSSEVRESALRLKAALVEQEARERLAEASPLDANSPPALELLPTTTRSLSHHRGAVVMVHVLAFVSAVASLPMPAVPCLPPGQAVPWHAQLRRLLEAEMSAGAHTAG